MKLIIEISNLIVSLIGAVFITVTFFLFFGATEVIEMQNILYDLTPNDMSSIIIMIIITLVIYILSLGIYKILYKYFPLKDWKQYLLRIGSVFLSATICWLATFLFSMIVWSMYTNY